jgi:hypothetical protein
MIALDALFMEDFAGSDGRMRFAVTQAFLQRCGLARV